MDHLEGTTHSMRSKEYELRNELYYALFDALGWKKPVMIVFSRLTIKNAPISKRLLVPLVKDGNVMGWDDPRLPTLEGLKRRGILPEVIRNFVLSFGLSKVESEPDWKKILSENRKMVDSVSARYFFVSDPVKVAIRNATLQKIKIKRHPKNDLGEREITVENAIYISKNDLESVKHGIFRLKDFYNLKMVSEKAPYAADYAGEDRVATKIQWVSEEKIDCEILVPGDLLKDGEYDPESLKILKGYCEKGCEQLNVGDIIQFERLGFCRLDKKTPQKLTFIYSC
jgi:glutamyl-tRNA synthetase